MKKRRWKETSIQIRPEEDKNGKPTSINIRNLPKILFDELKKLNDAQKAAVRRTGFQYLLELE